MTQEIEQPDTKSREQLGVFSEKKAPPAEVLSAILAETEKEIICFADHNNSDHAQIYGRDIIQARNFRVEVVDDPVKLAQVTDGSGHITLVATSARDPKLKDQMFTNFGLQLFADQNYVTQQGHCSLHLQCIGITNQGIHIVNEHLGNRQPTKEEINKLEVKRSEKIKSVFGSTTTTYVDFRRAMQSDKAKEVIIHALGPQGTNISQAAELYVDKHGLRRKTRIIVHERGIEPLEYAELAAHQAKKGIITVHIECAVYYDMGKLFDQRQKEMVFADHHYMPLDTMQLVSNLTDEELQRQSKIRVATHPSPRPLIKLWEDMGKAEWVKAPSNSAAAEMALNGNADACVTTEQTLVKLHWQPQFQHKFGSPMMIFTFGTPLNSEEVREYL